MSSDGVSQMNLYDPNKCGVRLWTNTGRGNECQCQTPKKYEQFGGTCEMHRNKILKDGGHKLGYYIKPRPEWWLQSDYGVSSLKKTQLNHEMKNPIRWKMPTEVYQREYSRILLVHLIRDLGMDRERALNEVKSIQFNKY